MTDAPGTSAEPPEVFIVLDAMDVHKVAAFWAKAMRYRRVDRLEQYVVLVPLEGAVGSVFLVQGVPESKIAKNRMHLDLHVVTRRPRPNVWLVSERPEPVPARWATSRGSP